jgi:hypothetical protein
MIDSLFYGTYVAGQYFVTASSLAPLVDPKNDEGRSAIGSFFTGNASAICAQLPERAEKISEYATWVIEGGKDLFNSSYDFASSYIALPVKNLTLFDLTSERVQGYFRTFKSLEGIETCKESFKNENTVENLAYSGMSYFSQVLSYGETIAKYEYTPHILASIAIAYAVGRLIRKTIKG